ncbi:MAG TPA: TonB-dependent receptor [Chitinophagaceae bacterium]
MKRKLSSLLLTLCFCGFVVAQERQVTGTVTKDRTGEALSGVTVTIKGSNLATTTNNDGQFTIRIPASRANPVLVFSYVGHTSKEVAVGNESEIITSLQEAASTSLDDVVVIGYGTARRRDVTSSVSSVNARQLRDIPLNSAAQALAGRLAGVQITGSEGSPNAEVLIRVRGGGSITQDNSPLYIIDGIQVENGLSTLSPQDIESIDVLKDASATAIYGARGANGVVIITTKSGRNNRTVVSYNGFVGVNKLANKLDVMKPYDFTVYQWERAMFTGDTSAIWDYGRRFDTLGVYKNAPFIDWQEEMFGRSAMMQTHNVSLNGGKQGTKYNLSLTSNTEEGIMRNSDFDRKLVTFKFDHTFSPKLNIGFSTRYNNTIVNGAGTSNSGSAGTNRLRQSVKYRPLLIEGQDVNDYDPDYAANTNANGLSLVNPLLLNDAEFRKNTTNIANIGGYVDLKLTSFLTFRTSGGLDYTQSRQTAFDDTITSISRQNSNQPLAFIGTASRVTLNNSNVLTYSNANGTGKFKDKNDLTVMAGHEIFQTKVTGENQLSRYFPVGISSRKALGNMNLGTNYIDNSRPPSYENQNRLVSFFSRVTYGYDDRFLFNVSVRADGSSKFAPDNKWSFFPSGSIAWRLSKENFYKWDKIANDVKIRVSYGEAGNNRIPDFLYLQQFTSGTQYWLNDQLVTGFLPPDLANPGLLWERIISRNIGLDASFLNNRLQFTLDVYKNTTKDLLVGVPVPTSSGYSRQIQNVGSTQNTGVEIQINATPVQRKDFSWNANFNLSYNKNKILSLGQFQKSYLENSGWGFSNTPADYIVRVGDPVGTMWGFTTDGYYTLDDFDYDATTKRYTLKPGLASNFTITSTLPQPGALRFKDIAGAPDSTGKPTGPDGKIDDNDKSIIGTAQPKFFGGLNQQFTYKNFDLSIFVNYSIGGDIYNANKLEFTSGYTGNANLLDIMNDRWRVTDANGNILQRVVTISGTQYVVGESKETLAAANAHNPGLWFPSTASTSFTLHSWAVEDASFLRINNITLGYSLPATLIKKVKLERARFYFTVNNLAVITNYTGYDPEVSARRSRPVTPGVDYSAYPRARTFLLGVNLSL